LTFIRDQTHETTIPDGQPDGKSVLTDDALRATETKDNQEKPDTVQPEIDVKEPEQNNLNGSGMNVATNMPNGDLSQIVMTNGFGGTWGHTGMLNPMMAMNNMNMMNGWGGVPNMMCKLSPCNTVPHALF